MSVLCALFFLLQLELSHADEIPCSNIEHSLCSNDTNKTIVFADCGNGVFNLTSQFCRSGTSDLNITGDKATVIECSNNTGMTFKNITNLCLKNLQIRNCYDQEFNGSIYIADCTNITIKNITIENSRGTGLVLENNKGDVVVENCTFQNNGHTSETYHSKYSFADSTHNTLLILKGGGGLRILVGNVNDSSISIQKCMFLNNTAFSGGGMLIFVHSVANRNNIFVHNSHFSGNKGCNDGGGGMRVGYAAAENKREEVVAKNSIVLEGCKFASNEALYGGGTAVFSTLGSYKFSQNKLHFTNCSWIRNEAKLGMAVDIAIAPWETYTKFGLFPSPVFTDCTFSGHNPATVAKIPNSVLSVTGFPLRFRGGTTFRDNYATALEATSAELYFSAYSNVEFIKNQGVNGGAMKLNGLSVMFVHDNSTFTFEENRADFGGAIYVESYKHSLISSLSCFIQYKSPEDKRQSPDSVFFNFTNNAAGFTDSECVQRGDYHCRYKGDSVYATTIAPCLGECLQSLSDRSYLNVTDALACIGSFFFDKPANRHISTAAHHFKLSETKYHDDKMCQMYLYQLRIYENKNHSDDKINPFKEALHLIPGKVETLPLKIVDELCGEIFFHVSVQALSSNIYVDPAYSLITNNTIVLHGQRGDSGTIQLSTVGSRTETITINVTLDNCPPGYIHHDNKTCICSASCPANRYNGIEHCDEKQFRAYVKHGYWVGNFDPNMPSLSSTTCPMGFCTTITHWFWYGLVSENGSEQLCPEGFCNFTANQSSETLLPPDNNELDLSRYICHRNREGRICGACKEGHSTYYRSMYFSCKPNNLCYLGWLIYILTELLPVTILFLVVIFFNISFTSGPLNGVVFFMQVVDTLRLNAENFIRVDPHILMFARVHKFAYRIFTLSIFAIEEFSFCLWRNASALDMLAFKYVTITYSLFLVVATVFLLKTCVCRRQRKVINLKRSIIHGLSAFIVMSYSECTRVSLMILTIGTVTVGPESTSKVYRYRAFYNGVYKYLGPEHLRYAIPAHFLHNDHGVDTSSALTQLPPMLQAVCSVENRRVKVCTDHM